MANELGASVYASVQYSEFVRVFCAESDYCDTIPQSLLISAPKIIE